MVSVPCLPIKEMCLLLLENLIVKQSKMIPILYVHIFFFSSQVHPHLLESHFTSRSFPPLPPADMHVDDLVSPRASCKGSWQTTDGCLWSDNNEQAPRQITSGTDRRHRGTKQEDKIQRRPRKTKGSGRCGALWSRQMRASSFDHFIKRNVTVTFSDEDETKKMCGAKHWWNATQSVSIALLWL